MRDLEFKEPDSMEEAEVRIAELRITMREIETQLGDRNRTDLDGKRLSSHDYYAWRKRARSALLHTEREYQFLKRWIQNRRGRLTADVLTANQDDGPVLLLRSWQLLKQLNEDGRVRYQSKEWALIDAIEQHLLNAV